MGVYDPVSGLAFVDGIALIDHRPNQVGHGTGERLCTGGTGVRIREVALNAAVGGTLTKVVITCQGCGGVFEIPEEVYPDARSLIKPEA